MAETSSSSEVVERRGIPAAAFVEDVQTYLEQSNFDVNTALAFLQERLQQYKLVEMKLLAQQRELQAKIPDIEKCLDIVATLQARKGSGEISSSYFSCKGVSTRRAFPEDMTHDVVTLVSTQESETSNKFATKPLLADFEVCEGIYSRARIEDSDSVCLWLGANVMLEYSCEEANNLLHKNLENAKASSDVLVGDLQFLRDQVTITQVTIARVYNWDVHQRRRQAASSSITDKDS